MATYGTPGTPTYSVTYPTLDQMLASVPDNNRQAIGSTAVRNSLFTLWYLINTYGYTAGMGPQGMTGPQGPGIGPQGFQGLQGFQGTGVQGGYGSTGSQGWQGFQGRGATGFQGNQGSPGPGYTGSLGPQGAQGSQGLIGEQGSTGTGYITGYSIALEMNNGYPQTILGASTTDGTVLHNGTTWSIPGWSSTLGNSGNNYLFKVYHTINKKILNMTTHGVNSLVNGVYSISVYGKSTAGTQYCTLIQANDFSYFSLYGVSYMSTGCAQSGISQVTITFQA